MSNDVASVVVPLLGTAVVAVVVALGSFIEYERTEDGRFRFRVRPSDNDGSDG